MLGGKSTNSSLIYQGLIPVKDFRPRLYCSHSHKLVVTIKNKGKYQIASKYKREIFTPSETKGGRFY